jgi:hypothetical protein
VNVGANEFLTQAADFRKPIAAASKPMRSESSKGFEKGRLELAAWVSLTSASTVSVLAPKYGRELAVDALGSGKKSRDLQ